MTRMTLLSLLIQGIPETICFVLLLYSLLKVKLKWSRVVPIGITGAIIIYLIRLLPLPLGVHTIIVMIFYFFTIKALTKQRALSVFYAIFVSNFVLFASEIFFNELIMRLLHRSFESVADDSLVWALMGLPQVLLLLMLALWLDKRNRLRASNSVHTPAATSSSPLTTGAFNGQNKDQPLFASEEPVLEHITTIHLLCFLICIITLICYHGNRITFLGPWRFTVYLSVVIPFVYWTITSFMYKRFFQNDALKHRMNIIYALLTLCIVFLTVYSAGNNASPVKLLFLIPIIISGTVLGRLSSLITAAAVGSYYLLISLGDNSAQGGLLVINLIFALVMLLAAWLVGEFTEIQKKNRKDLATVNENLEQMVDERTGALTEEIGERRRAEEALRESEERFRSIFNNASVGVALIDNENRILTANEAYCRYFGYTLDELAGTPCSKITHPEDLELGAELHEALIRGELDSYVLEKRHIRRDGVIIWGRINASLIRDEHGGALYKVVVCEDITSLKAREQELTAQQRVYRAMLGALEEATATAESHYEEIRSQADLATSVQFIDYEETVVERILQVACEITGATCAKYLKYDDSGGYLSLASTVGRSDAFTTRANEKFQSLKVGDGMLPGQAEIPKKPLYLPALTGSNWMQVDPDDRSAYLIPLRYGEKLFGLVVLISDRADGFPLEQRSLANTLVSCFSNAIENARLFAETRSACEKLNTMQQQLHQAQKMEAIGQLAGGMAHELNNQLTVIQACVDLHLYRHVVDEVQRSSYLKIRQAAERSANLARQLLLFGRKHPQFKVQLNLNQNIEESVKMLDKLIGEDIKLDLDLQPNLWPIKADAANIDQVLVNLVINARDAMPQGGRIAIKTSNIDLREFTIPGQVATGSFVGISVSDTGTGMDEETAAHIFEPFFTTKERGKGTGLGLSVVYGIIQDHDGFLKVKSRVGEGSVFSIYLPALHAGGELHNEETLLQQREFRGNGESILLVEDDPEVMKLTGEILTENNYNVSACNSYNDALLSFMQNNSSFDLVLSDIILPDGRGTGLAVQLRDLRPSLPVLLCSGYADDRTNLEGLQQEGVEFIPKPYTANDLLRRIQEALNRSARVS